MPIYAFGSNGSGQLGIGSLEDVSSPQLCQFISEDQAVRPSGFPVKIAAGGNTTYVLFKSNDLYRAGRSPISSADQQPSSSNTFQKMRSAKYSKTRMCSATWDSAVFVNADNEVFVEGSGPAGELGLGRETKYSEEALKLQGFPPSDLEIVDIASCVSHTVAVLSNGDVWGWGNGRKGQLGEPADVIWEPRRFEGIRHRVVRVACGREFTFLVGDASVGAYSIFGSDKWGIKATSPDGNLRGWKDIGASWGSVFVLGQNGRITSWGRCDRGQLASPGLPIVELLAVGSEHVLALTSKGNVAAWGWGEHGNCGSQTDHEGNVTLGGWNNFPANNHETADNKLGIGAGCATSFIWSA